MNDDGDDDSAEFPLCFEKKIMETDEAWLLEFNDNRQEWFPKSICELERDNNTKRNYVIVPNWLVIEKGLDDYI